MVKPLFIHFSTRKKGGETLAIASDGSCLSKDSDEFQG